MLPPDPRPSLYFAHIPQEIQTLALVITRFEYKLILLAVLARASLKSFSLDIFILLFYAVLNL